MHICTLYVIIIIIITLITIIIIIIIFIIITLIIIILEKSSTYSTKASSYSTSISTSSLSSALYLDGYELDQIIRESAQLDDQHRWQRVQLHLLDHLLICEELREWMRR
jgi:uncharacterized alpha/beta hydrolase family protein